jgi:hypothetical protein
MRRTTLGALSFILTTIVFLACSMQGSATRGTTLSSATSPLPDGDTLQLLTKPEIVEVQQLVVKLKCATCHIENDDGQPGDMFAATFPRMSRMMDSTQVDSFTDFMLDPQTAKPGVNMPSFWGSPSTAQVVPIKMTVLATPRAQTNAIARYIYSMTRVPETRE